MILLAFCFRFWEEARYYSYDEEKQRIEIGGFLMEWENSYATLRRINGDDFRFANPGSGRKNSLLVDTIELFGPRHAQGALLLRLCDPANMIMIHESVQLAEAGIPPLPRALLPDIILYQEQKQFLFLIGISTMSGTMSVPRKAALEQQIAERGLRCIYVSAFFDRQDYTSGINKIAWHSYAWLAHEPDHMIIHW